MSARRPAVWALAALAIAAVAAYDRIGSVVSDPKRSNWSWGAQGPTDDQLLQMVFIQFGQSFALPALALLIALAPIALLVVAARGLAVRWAGSSDRADVEPDASVTPDASASLGHAHDEGARVDAEVGRDD